jgi:hypothetical protein
MACHTAAGGVDHANIATESSAPFEKTDHRFRYCVCDRHAGTVGEFCSKYGVTYAGGFGAVDPNEIR